MRIVSLILLLLISVGVSAQVQTANFKAISIDDGNEFDLIFKAADNILYSLEIHADRMKQPIKLRIDKRLPNGLSFADASNSGSANRMIIEIGKDVLTIRDARNNKVGYAHWLYDGPVDGRGTGCSNCLERVGELKGTGSGVNFVSTKMQCNDQTVEATDRLPVGSNIAFFTAPAQAQTRSPANRRLYFVATTYRWTVA